MKPVGKNQMINCCLDLDYRAKRRVVTFLDKLETQLGRGLLNRTIEEHRVIDGWFQVTFQIAQCEGSKEEKVYDFLKLTQLIESRPWCIHGPREMETIFIDASLDNTDDDQPLKLAHLQSELHGLR